MAQGRFRGTNATISIQRPDDGAWVDIADEFRVVQAIKPPPVAFVGQTSFFDESVFLVITIEAIMKGLTQKALEVAND